jgi:hypothetical protein
VALVTLQPARAIPQFHRAAGCFRIVVDVHNSVWGPLFGYRGSFNVEWRKVTEAPSHILPKRQERRD